MSTSKKSEAPDFGATRSQSRDGSHPEEDQGIAVADIPTVTEDSEAATKEERYSHPPFRRRVSVTMTLWLTLVWVAVFSSATPIVILSGILLGVLIQLIFPLPVQRNLWHPRPLRVVILVAWFIWDLVVAGVYVSYLVVSGKDHRDGIIRVDTLSDNPVYLTILAGMSSMVPGSIVVKLDPAEKALYLHILDIDIHGGVQGCKAGTQEQEKRILRAFATNSVLEEAGLASPRVQRRKAKSARGEE